MKCNAMHLDDGMGGRARLHVWIFSIVCFQFFCLQCGYWGSRLPNSTDTYFHPLVSVFVSCISWQIPKLQIWKTTAGKSVSTVGVAVRSLTQCNAFGWCEGRRGSCKGRARRGCNALQCNTNGGEKGRTRRGGSEGAVEPVGCWRGIIFCPQICKSTTAKTNTTPPHSPPPAPPPRPTWGIWCGFYLADITEFSELLCNMASWWVGNTRKSKCLTGPQWRRIFWKHQYLIPWLFAFVCQI